MIILIISALIIGIVLGYFSLIPSFLLSNIDFIITALLMMLLFVVGFESGSNKKIIKDMKKYGIKILLIPLAVMIGSIAFSAAAVLFFNLNLFESFAIGAGVGYYSLSSIIITQLLNSELGVIAFLANIIRETLTITMAPLLVRFFGMLSPVASAGATSMDTSLGVIREYTNAETAFIAVLSGIILTIAVPILVTLFCNMAII